MTNELIEAMARAVYDAIEVGEDAENIARAALAAAEAAGYRLVPVEITEPMLDVMHDRIRILCDPERRTANIRNDREVWAAMLAAAPDHVEEVRQMVSVLVPTSERLPERDQYPVLVAHRSGAVRLVFGISPFGVGDWMGYYEPSRQGRFLSGITHWMPLPEATAPKHIQTSKPKQGGSHERLQDNR